MADEDPNIELPDVDDNEGFPWITIIAVIAVFLLGGAWLYLGRGYKAGGQTAAAALQSQLVTEKATLADEKQKVFDMTQDLDALKQQIATGQAGNKAEAVAKYNQLAKDQNAQREKVKRLADDYNAKVEKLHELQ
jgi:hypothetical protein